MKNTFKIEIVGPEKIIFSSEDMSEVILPSYEGEIGILKDHISIISFLKPGIIKIFKSSESAKSFFVQSGIIEFNNNNLTILSSDIIDLNYLKKEKIEQLIAEAEKILEDKKLNDGNRYLVNQKIDTLRYLNFN